jgi:hypothetical protein
MALEEGETPYNLAELAAASVTTRPTAPAVAATQTGSYVQADVQTIATAVNSIRTALLNYGMLL